MGITIDFAQAAPRLRPGFRQTQAADDIKAKFKLGLEFALSTLDPKIAALEQSISALDRSRCDVGALEAQLCELKWLVLVARAAVGSL